MVDGSLLQQSLGDIRVVGLFFYRVLCNVLALVGM